MSSEEGMAVLTNIMERFTELYGAWKKGNSIKINGQGITNDQMAQGTARLASEMLSRIVANDAEFNSAMINKADDIVTNFGDLGSPGLASLLALMCKTSPMAFSTMCLALTSVFCYDRSVAGTLRLADFGTRTRDPWCHLASAVLVALNGTFLFPKAPSGTDTTETANLLPDDMIEYCPGDLRKLNWSICGQTFLVVMMRGGKTAPIFTKAHEIYIKGSTAFGVFAAHYGVPASVDRFMDMGLKDFMSKSPNATDNERTFSFICEYLREVQGGRNASSEVLRHGALRTEFTQILAKCKTSASFKKAASDKDAPGCDAALGFLDSEGVPLYKNLTGEVRVVNGASELIYTGLSLPSNYAGGLVEPMSRTVKYTNTAIVRPSNPTSFNGHINNALSGASVAPVEDQVATTQEQYLGYHGGVIAKSKLAGMSFESDEAREAAFVKLKAEAIKKLTGAEVAVAAAKPGAKTGTDWLKSASV